MEPNRLETGVIQDRDDWPGVFIRGDHALMGYLPAIQKLTNNEPLTGFDRMALKQLCLLLKSCDTGAQPMAPRQYVIKQPGEPT